MKFPREQTMKLLVISLLLYMHIAGCTALQRATGTETYVIPKVVYEKIQQDLQVKDCPEGETAIAVVIEAKSGGGILTVGCQ